MFTLYEDSKPAIKWTSNMWVKERTKHIASRYYFVKQLYTNKLFKLVHLAGSDHPGDILTKNESSTKRSKVMHHIMGREITHSDPVMQLLIDRMHPFAL